MTAPTFVDVELLVRQWLAQQFPSVRVVTETPNNLEKVCPVVQVVRVGGSDRGHLDAALMVVAVFDVSRPPLTSRDNAAALASDVRRAMKYSMPGVTVGGCVVTRVDTVQAPAFKPDANTNVRHFPATYRVCVQTHP